MAQQYRKAEPYKLAFTMGQAAVYLLPLAGQYDGRQWRNLCVAWEIAVEDERLQQCNWQVTRIRSTCMGTRVALLPCVPGGKVQYAYLQDDGGVSHLAMR